jgi:DNA-binding NarL/FixJ family response regulator
MGAHSPRLRVMTAPEPDFGRHEDAVLSAEPLERLKAHSLSAVTAIVPVTIAWFFGVDRRHQFNQAILLQNGRHDLAPDVEWRRYLAWISDDDPFAAAKVEARGATVLACKDFDEELIAPYRRHLDAVRIRDRADIYLRVAGTIIVQFALFRSDELDPFSAADLTALRRLQPLLEHAFACALEPAETAGAHKALRESGLSDREAEVAEMVGRGSTNSEIARSLHLSEATVKTHLTRVYAKLGVRTRTQLALLLGDRRAS